MSRKRYEFTAHISATARSAEEAEEFIENALSDRSGMFSSLDGEISIELDESSPSEDDLDEE